MADTIKCPNCGSSLKFDPESQKLGCDFCGASFDPSLFQDEVSELTAEEYKAQEAAAQAQPVSQPDASAA